MILKITHPNFLKKILVIIAIIIEQRRDYNEKRKIKYLCRNGKRGR